MFDENTIFPSIISDYKTKHVKVARHFIKLESGLICVSTNYQLANILTNELVNSSFDSILGKLGMENVCCIA